MSGVAVDSQIDPQSFSDGLVRAVLPSILQGDVPEYELSRASVERVEETRGLLDAFLRDPPEIHQQALLDAAAPFAPPPSLARRDETYAIIIGMIALRATTSEFLYEYSVVERYQRAAGWVCENFNKIIWWDCDA